jgi:hypothetical protein
VLPEFIGEKATQELMRRSRGRPQKADKKVNQTLWLDPDVLEAFRQEERLQARINQVLRKNMPRRQKQAAPQGAIRFNRPGSGTRPAWFPVLFAA